MILRAQIFISTVIRTTNWLNTIYERATQSKFLPEGPLLLILENIYVFIFQIQIYSKEGMACPKTTSGSAKRSSVSAFKRGSLIFYSTFVAQLN